LYIYFFAGVRALFGGKKRRYAEKNGIESASFRLLLEDYSENRGFLGNRLT